MKMRLFVLLFCVSALLMACGGQKEAPKQQEPAKQVESTVDTTIADTTMADTTGMLQEQ